MFVAWDAVMLALMGEPGICRCVRSVLWQVSFLSAARQALYCSLSISSLQSRLLLRKCKLLRQKGDVSAGAEVAADPLAVLIADSGGAVGGALQGFSLLALATSFIGTCTGEYSVACDRHCKRQFESFCHGCPCSWP